MYSKAYGLKKVLLRHNEKFTTPFQELKTGDILETKHYNRFTYESKKKIYDIEVYYNGTIEYYINWNVSEKTKYHEKIETYYKNEITESIH